MEPEIEVCQWCGGGGGGGGGGGMVVVLVEVVVEVVVVVVVVVVLVEEVVVEVLEVVEMHMGVVCQWNGGGRQRWLARQCYQ